MKSTFTSIGALFAAAITAHAVEHGTANSAKDQKAANTIQMPQGISSSLWAAPHLVSNPVAFAFDEKGRMFIAETFRQGTGVPDNRGHMYSLVDDIAAKTIEDRVKKYEKWQNRTPLSIYTQDHDQVSLVMDVDGDGVADKSQVFAGPFKETLDGTAAGLLALDGDIWLTSIPHLWRFRDNNGDLKSDQNDRVYTGFGVRDAFRGHDMHGLVLGNDGRIYFSMADRGYSIPMPDGSRLEDPMDNGRGGVFRCWPDGSGLELYAKGLRNPQELAFDEFGNLFTVDNNSDSEDQARLVHIIEGGDSGWCMVYQYGTPAITEANYNRGPWNAEKMWYTRTAGQPAWVLPPLAHFTNGPSGLVYNPGVTALGDSWKRSFFICDFRGGSANSGVHNFTVEPDGAGFRLGKLDKFLWNILATDVDFGIDGRLYVSDWIDGWNGIGEGKIFAFANPQFTKTEKLKEVEALFKQGFAVRSIGELKELLSHPDMRIRLRSQFALAKKAQNNGQEAKVVFAAFSDLAKNGKDTISRLHGVWGLGSLRQQVDQASEELLTLLQDKDVQVQAQVVKTLGDLSPKSAANVFSKLVAMFSGKTTLPVKAQLGVALSKLSERAYGKDQNRPEFAEPRQKVIAELVKNQDKDLVVRHALSLALSKLATAKELASLSTHDQPSVRIAAVLALREKGAPEVKAFLDDAQWSISTEAARVIYDLNLSTAFADLANQLKHAKIAKAPEAFTLRALNAAYTLGGEVQAELIADWAAHGEVAEASRREALWLLGNWGTEQQLDRVAGFYRPLPARDSVIASKALQRHLDAVLQASGKIADEALRSALQLNAELPEPILVGIVKDGKRDETTRIEALRLLAKGKVQEQIAVLEASITAQTPALLRIEAALILSKIDAARSAKVLEELIQGSKNKIAQRAIAALAESASKPADEALQRLGTQLLEGKLAKGLQLDVLDASKKREFTKSIFDRWSKSLPADDPFAQYQVAIEGGDIEKGRNIFANHTAAQCMRCHKVAGGGGLAGPELSGVGLRAERPYLLQSLLNPSAVVVPGYGAGAVTLKSGEMVAGVLKAENEKSLTFVDGEGKEKMVPLDQVAERTPMVSSMPPMLGILTPNEMRDLVAYMKSLGMKKSDIIE